MSDVEITGKSVEEARELAAEALGASIEEIRHEVLEESGKGFLGLGHARVRIRAWLAEAAPGEKLQPESREAVEPVSEPAPTVPLSEQPEELLSIVRQVLTAMQLDARADIRSATVEEIQADIKGPDVAILIGRQGQTLDALQYLLGIAINKRHHTRTRVILDAEGYRDRHREMLEARAREFVEKVKSTGQEAVLDPLSARDRRIIHTFLADDPEVTTYSEGEGENRRLVITPRK